MVPAPARLDNVHGPVGEEPGEEDTALYLSAGDRQDVLGAPQPPAVVHNRDRQPFPIFYTSYLRPHPPQRPNYPPHRPAPQAFIPRKTRKSPEPSCYSKYYPYKGAGVACVYDVRWFGGVTETDADYTSSVCFTFDSGAEGLDGVEGR